MSEMIDLSDAPGVVRDLVARSQQEPIIFVEGDREVAILSSSAKQKDERVNRRQPGQMKGRLRVVVDDDEHLEGFKEYLP